MEVLPSVTASVLTTVIAFMPLLFVSGVMGKFIAVMPIAVIAMLVISLIESSVLLPCHLAHVRLRLVDHSVSWGQVVWAGMSQRAGRHSLVAGCDHRYGGGGGLADVVSLADGASLLSLGSANTWM